MQYTVTIPGWIPNPRRRRETRKLVAAHCQRMGVTVVKGQRRVTITFRPPGGGSVEMHLQQEMAEQIVDALRWSAMLQPTNAMVVTHQGDTSNPMDQGTTIELMDLIMEEVS